MRAVENKQYLSGGNFPVSKNARPSCRSDRFLFPQAISIRGISHLKRRIPRSAEHALARRFAHVAHSLGCAAKLDDALQNKVVLCSPFSLYAILTVIRQSMDNFRFEQNSRRILDIVAEFRKHWTKYVESMEKMGRRIADADETYRELTSTRTRQLDRQLDKIDDMIQARSAAPSSMR